MKKNFAILLIIGAILAVVFFLIKSKSSGKPENNSSQVLSSAQNSPTATPSVAVVPADKIEVVHFHGENQCWSCITVGQYALKTIKEKFPEEFASGKIVYKDINGELKENREIVMKYQARGSSLFINAIRVGKDDIAEDVTVWRLVNSESQFVNYFENKLKSLLGK